MSSYYNKVNGNLRPNLTARVADINLMQANIQEAIQKLTTDVLGPNFILGEEEEALKVVATTDVIDQANYNTSEDDAKQWISFYDRYLRQSIYITKSSIETVTVHMRNLTNISTTIYAEIRDIDFDLVAESSAILDPTNQNADADKTYTPITFNFNKHHLPIGHYYFVLRPVDISATDLADKTTNTIIDEYSFLVKYDIDGTYHAELNETIEDNEGYEEIIDITPGLEASYDGANYLDAVLLEEYRLSDDERQELNIDDPNFDLFFEETFSSGLTFLVNPGEAIVLGEKVDSFDTHVKIGAPPTSGNRTDLIILRNTGELDVKQGDVCPDETRYPNDDNGLKLAYITVYQNGSKVALIEQDDENGMTRRRDILERLRRLEKKLNYQVENNSPSRIKYNCEVDPIMYHDGLSENVWDSEGTYGMGLGMDDEGKNIITNTETLTYIWSIIKSTYKYSYEETIKETAYCRVFNVDAKANNKTSPQGVSDGLYCAKISEKEITSTSPTSTLKHPIKGEKVKVQVKKGKKIKYTKTTTTNKKGEATLNLKNAKLASGKYTVTTTVGNKTINTTFTVHTSSYKVSSPGSKLKKVTLTDRVKTTTKDNLKNQGIIYGDDAFDTSNITVDTKKGIIELAKVDNSSDKYKKNKPLSTDKTSKPYFNSDVYEYKVYSNKKNLKSEFPVLHLKFDRDTHIKSIKPYIKKFKNMKSFGILLFKNDQILNIKQHKRKLVEKSFKKDPVYPNIFKATKTLNKPKKGKDGLQTLDSYVTFDTDIKLEAGTYTLVIYGKLLSGKEEGSFFLREFDTHGNLEKYGMSAKSTGSSNLSLLKMSTSNLTSRSWNVVFNQKPDVYYEKGVITSVPKSSTESIKSCKVKKNLITPEGCSSKLEVSNDGGNHWIDITNVKGTVKFGTTSNVFRWRLTLEGNGKYTPQLYYKPSKKYAIKFSLNAQAKYTPYEDFGRCYETPLLNANAITRTFVANNLIKDRFSEWEFARLYMLDEDDSSSVDICISYDNDNYNTGVQTTKDNWGSNIFFSQIFADLKLSDFSTTSVDYDNYDANTEFDEHNYPFKMTSEAVKHDNAQINFASYPPNNDDYFYGNINNPEIAPIVNELFTYTSVIENYEYSYREDDETHQYSGSIQTKGPYCLATFMDPQSAPTTSYATYDDYDDVNKGKYIINGVSFSNPLDLSENESSLSLQVFLKSVQTIPETPGNDTDGDNPPISSTPTTIPEGTFSVVVALTPDGTLTDDNSNGIAYPINSQLTYDQYNTIYVDLSENIEQYAANGIYSIGIRVEKPENLKAGEGIGLGLINASSYNRRPYTSYMYTGNWNRLKWKTLNDNAHIFNLIRGPTDKNKELQVLYPTSYMNNTASNTTFSNIPDIEGLNYAHAYSGTNTTLEHDPATQGGSAESVYKVTSISRDKNQITATIEQQKNNSLEETHTLTTTQQGNKVLFKFPANVTGDIFKIDVDIPFSIYDLIDIEYYIYSDRFKSTKTKDNRTNNVTNTPTYTIGDGNRYDYHYYGNFSKGDIKIKFFDADDNEVETFNLPSWGRIQQNATVNNKNVHAWFKKKSAATRIKSIVIERANPTESAVDELRLVLSNILLYNAEYMPALGPQMQMRIYPGSDDLNEIQIRKVGCIYRI